MSVDGILTFQKNMEILMKSEGYRKADLAEQMELQYRLLNSKYGKGSYFGFGKVQPLEEKK